MTDGRKDELEERRTDGQTQRQTDEQRTDERTNLWKDGRKNGLGKDVRSQSDGGADEYS